jgi:hypothetical protein
LKPKKVAITGKCIMCGRKAKPYIIQEFYESDIIVFIHDKCWKRVNMEDLNRVVELKLKDRKSRI